MKIQLDVIIPVFNYMPTSTAERIRTLNHILSRWIGLYNVEMHVVIVEQTIDKKVHFIDKIKKPRTLHVETILLCAPVRRYEAPEFYKGWLINVGVRRSYSPYVMIADCDIFSPNDIYLSVIEYMIEKGLPWCFGYDRIFYTDQKEKEDVFNTNFLFVSKVNSYNYGTYPQPQKKIFTPSREYVEGGYVFYQRDFFNRIGCAHEYLRGLGGHDNELARRAEYVSHKYEMYPALVYHLWHPVDDNLRIKNKPYNLDKYYMTKKKTDQVIEWMKMQKCGSPAGPLSSAKKFLE